MFETDYNVFIFCVKQVFQDCLNMNVGHYDPSIHLLLHTQWHSEQCYVPEDLYVQ